MYGVVELERKNYRLGHAHTYNKLKSGLRAQSKTIIAKTNCFSISFLYSELAWIQTAYNFVVQSFSFRAHLFRFRYAFFGFCCLVWWSALAIHKRPRYGPLFNQWLLFISHSLKAKPNPKCSFFNWCWKEKLNIQYYIYKRNA